MARWDDLHRAIAAGDLEGAEPVWLELIEKDSGSVAPFLDAAEKIAGRQGGKRHAGILLWMLAEHLKGADRPRDQIAVYARLAGMAPDDGTVRAALIEAAREAYGERSDLPSLLEKSGVEGGPPSEFAVQASRLEQYLLLEKGAYVFHKSGWGVGRIVELIPDRSRCVIDFRTKPGHEMDIDAAVDRLERLDESDIRAMAMSDPKGLRKLASERPLEVIRQVLGRFSGAANLRHVKDALVPDAVATTRWSTWWKAAKKAALLDPRFHVGTGRDPRLEYFGSANVDFATQVDRSFTASATVEDRQKAGRELLATATEDESAREVLAEAVESELAKVHAPQLRLGWELILSDLGKRDRGAVLRSLVADAEDPGKVLSALSDDATRDTAARALMSTRDDGARIVLDRAIADDDPVLADVGVDRFESSGHAEYVALLLDTIDRAPAGTPTLYAWFVRGLRKRRWEGRAYEPFATVQRVLKVLDAVEYRARRTGSAAARKGVTSLCDLLARNEGQIIKEACADTDRYGAAHLLAMLDRNRGLKARQLQKTQDMILRAHPDALKDDTVAVGEGEPEVGERLDRIYMTPQGLQKLKAEADRIQNEEMPANAAEIARAREFGDLSENAEYHAAREKQSLLQARLDAMKSDLARAVALTPDVVRADAVSVGARVRLKDAAGQDVSYTLLGPPDADVSRGIINYLTPLGQALMGRKIGETVRVELGEDTRELEVLEIENGLEKSREHV